MEGDLRPTRHQSLEGAGGLGWRRMDLMSAHLPAVRPGALADAALQGKRHQSPPADVASRATQQCPDTLVGALLL
jgi:hypothetical protein